MGSERQGQEIHHIIPFSSSFLSSLSHAVPFSFLFLVFGTAYDLPFPTLSLMWVLEAWIQRQVNAREREGRRDRKGRGIDGGTKDGHFFHAFLLLSTSCPTYISSLYLSYLLRSFSPFTLFFPWHLRASHVIMWEKWPREERAREGKDMMESERGNERTVWSHFVRLFPHFLTYRSCRHQR